MNTYVTISVPSDTENSLLEKAFLIVERLDKIITESRGCPAHVNPELLPLVRVALKIAEITNGSYDPTIYPVTNIWGMYNCNWRVPDRNEINEALKRVGWEKVKIFNNKLVVPDRMGFDFGGVGKGWVVDEVVGFLKENGVREGIVDAGGDLRVWGDRMWRVGIKNPSGEGLAAVIEVQNKAVATSGDYENYYECATGKFHHIIDSKNGYPVAGEIHSVTAVTDKCADADGLATGVFVAGKNGLSISEQQYSCKYVIISKNFNYVSSGIVIRWFENDQK